MKISISKFSLLLALYFLLVMNYPFSKEFYATLGGFHFGNLWDVTMVYIALFMIMFLVFYLTSSRYLTKPIAIFLIITSSLVSYTILNYNTEFTSLIIRSVFLTNFVEASSFFSFHFVGYAFFVAAIPSAIVYRAKIEYPTFGKFLLKKVLAVLLVVISSFAIYFPNQLFFNSLVDNAKNYQLKTMILPFNYLGAFRDYLNEEIAEKAAALQPHLDKKAFKREKVHFEVKRGIVLSHSGKKTIFVFVLGESARARSFSLNGYNRETNPMLKKQPVISFTQFHSCGTATAIAVPCLFSNLGEQGFSYRRADQTDNLLDVAQQANYKVTWYENGMGSQNVTSDIKEIALGSYYEASRDRILVDKLPSKNELAKDNKDQFIILHQRGSHGPDYASRYTDQFRKFTPDCNSPVLKSCSRDSVINAYDNTILYTDNNLNDIIEYLKGISGSYNTAMVYVSDHGESTGEYGWYMHGLPINIAPDDQTHIPFIVWFSDSFKHAERLDTNCISRLKDRKYSQDDIFHSVVGLLDIQTSAYNKNLDMFKECRH